MLKLFNHYVPSTTIHQLVFDALLLFVAVVAAFVLQARLDGALVASVVPSAFIFALTMMILNGALGLYRPGDGGEEADGRGYQGLGDAGRDSGERDLLQI